ncbi:Integral membrane protein YccS N-terminal domain-containing protein [Bordetella sputigena]|uniref:FUSC family protein n=1 Tax=Bordetella sputigena TaxID=1416810 RepID=UPI0039EE8016
MPATQIILQFLYSQHAFTALRTLLGVMLPAGYGVLMFDNIDLGLGLALGAFCVSLVDIPEAFRLKPRRMLAATVILGLAAAAITVVMHHPLAAWVVLLVVAFCAGLATAYGTPGTLIGLCALIGVDLMLAQHDAGGPPWPFMGWMVCGGLWYTAFSTALCALFPQQIARRAVGESLMAAAAHLRRRAECFIPGIPLDQCRRRLAEAQSTAIDAQQIARDVVLGDLTAQPGRQERRLHLFDTLTDAIDVHDISLALHDDFTALRTGGAEGRAARRVHDAIQDMARWIEDLVPRYVVGKTVAAPPPGLAWRGRDGAPAQGFNARLDVLAGILTRLARDANAGARGGKMQSTSASDDAARAEVAVALRTWNPPAKPPTPWQAVRASPAAARYALRLTAAMAAGTLVANWIGGHSTWVILTIMIVMSPTFGANQQRSRQRIAGTLLGCLGTAVLLWLGVQAPWLVASLIVVSYGTCFALARPASYLPSVFFGTVAVLLLYHLLVPGWSMIEQRGLDTLIGGAIGAIGAFLLPAWEYRGLDAKLAAARLACRDYAAAVFADGFDMTRYRVTRRSALVSVRALTAAHQRMLQEPRAQQRSGAEIGMWLAACNVMIAALAALGQWRRSNDGAVLPAGYRQGAELVDRTLDGAVPADNDENRPAARRRIPDTGAEPQALPGLAPLLGAARSMQRANARLASALRRTASSRVEARSGT